MEPQLADTPKAPPQVPLRCRPNSAPGVGGRHPSPQLPDTTAPAPAMPAGSPAPLPGRPSGIGQASIWSLEVEPTRDGKPAGRPSWAGRRNRTPTQKPGRLVPIIRTLPGEPRGNSAQASQKPGRGLRFHRKRRPKNRDIYTSSHRPELKERNWWPTERNTMSQMLVGQQGFSEFFAERLATSTDYHKHDN